MDDLEKIIEKVHKTPEERIKQIDEELKEFESIKFKDTLLDEDTKRQKILKEAKEILLSQLENENTKQKEREAEELLFNNMLGYFEKYPNKKLGIWEVLNKSEVIYDEVNDVCKQGYQKQKNYLLMNYSKISRKVYNIYKSDIEQAKEARRKQEKARTKQKKMLNGWGGVIAFNAMLNKVYRDVLGKRR